MRSSFRSDPYPGGVPSFHLFTEKTCQRVYAIQKKLVRECTQIGMELYKKNECHKSNQKVETMDFSSVSSPDDASVTMEDTIETGIVASQFTNDNTNVRKSILRSPTFESDSSDDGTKESSIEKERNAKRYPGWLLPVAILALLFCSFGVGLGLGMKYYNDGEKASQEPNGLDDHEQPQGNPNPDNNSQDFSSDETGYQFNSRDDSSSSDESSPQEPELLVGVYYYPYDDGFSEGNYLRRQLDPPQFPELGAYNHRDSSVISKHLQWTRQANINLWVLDWQGRGSTGDITTRNHIMNHAELRGTKIAMHYDAKKRIPADTMSVDEIYADIDYMARVYFSDPNYLTIDGRPVVYVYLTRWLEGKGIFEEVINLIRTAAADNGYKNIYIVGDHAFATPPPRNGSFAAFDSLDAVTNFDVYGSMGMRRYAYESGIEAYKEKQLKWKDAAALQECGFIPSVTPGFNARATQGGLTAMSRRLSPYAPVGSLFQSLMANGLELVDNSAGKILMINSWNMWSEDTQIEPVSIDAGNTVSPMSMTQDLNYGSYGSLFLDIVRATTNGNTLTLQDEEPPVPYPEYEGDLTVGVYYYPWHGNNDFHGKEYLRGELEPPQLPLLGEYSDRDPAIVAQHLAWTKSANVKLWVTSWWGPGSTTDITTRDIIMPHPDLPGTKIALFYEATRLATNGNMADTEFELDMDKIELDFDYMAKTYFSDSNYYKIGGRPVVYVYLARVLGMRGDLEEFAIRVRSAVKENGYDIYIVGDAAFGSPDSSSYELFESLDAVTNYDMYGSLGRPRHVGEEGIERYKTSQGAWRQAAKGHGGCDFVPALGPGYNDRGVRPQNDHAAMSRKLTPDAPEGSLFAALLPEAFNLADSDTGGIVMINSFNEWHEDSQIEPVVDVGLTAEPFNLTQDLEYQAYGKLYLNILRDATVSFNSA